MAEDTIILSVEIETGQTEEKLAALKLEMGKLQQAQKEVKAAYDSGTISQDQYISATAENAGQQRVLRTQIQQVTNVANANAKATELNTKDNKTNTGSIVEMRNNLSTLKGAYAALTKQQRESSTGKELQRQIGEQNAALKDIEGSYGDYQRNVGDYTNSILSALGQLIPGFSGLSDVMGAAQTAQQIYAQTVGMTSAATSAQTAATGAQAAAQSSATAATTTATVAQRGFNMAMLANPIGLLVVALIAVFTYLTQFSGALDGVEQMFKGLTMAAKPLIQTIGGLGKIFIDIFSVVGDAVMGIVKTVAKIATGDFQGAADEFNKGFDKIKAGVEETSKSIDSYAKSFDGLTGKMGEAYAEGVRIAKMLQDLDDAEAELALNRIDREAQASKLELAAGDRARSANARLKDLQTAGKITKQLAKEDLDVAKMRYEAQRAELLANDDLSRLRGLSNAELQKQMKVMDAAGTLQGDYAKDVAKLAEMYKVLVDAEEKAGNVELEVNAKTGRLRNTIATEREAQVKKAIDMAKQLAELEVELAKDGYDKAVAKQKLLAMQRDNDLTAAGTNVELKKAIEAKYNKDVLALNKELTDAKKAADALAIENEATRREELKAKQESDQQDELTKLEESLKAKELLLAQSAAEGNVSETERNALELQLQSEHLTALLALQQQYGLDTVETETNIAKAKIAAKAKAAQESQRIADAEVATARNTVKIMGNLATLLMGQGAQSSEFAKGLALAQIAIDTGSAIAGIVRIASTTSPDPITFGVQLSAGIATVLGNIAQATSILSSASTPAPPSFERGGMIYGPSHTNGGVMINAQGGEMVVNRGGVRMGGDLVKQLNAAGNGDAIAIGRINGMNQSTSDATMFQMLANLPVQTLNVIDLDRVQTDSGRVTNNARLAKSA
jgi:hypothetical protein